MISILVCLQSIFVVVVVAIVVVVVHTYLYAETWQVIQELTMIIPRIFGCDFPKSA